MSSIARKAPPTVSRVCGYQRFKPLRAVSEAEGEHGEGSRRRPVCMEASRWNAARSMEDGEGFAPVPD